MTIHRAAGGSHFPDWRGLLDRSDVLVVDTETTGFGGHAEVIEVAGVDTTGAVSFEALALPQGYISSGAIRCHGLTLAKLEAEGARPWPQLWAELAPILTGASAVLAWNAGFDCRMLHQTNARHGLPMPALAWRDLLTDDRALRPGGSHSLQEAARREGVAVDTAHRARADCITALAVMRAVAGRHGVA